MGRELVASGLRVGCECVVRDWDWGRRLVPGVDFRDWFSMVLASLRGLVFGIDFRDWFSMAKEC